MLLSMGKSGWLVTPTHQQPTTPAIMDMTWTVHTPGNASMMVDGVERLQNAAHQGEVSMHDYHSSVHKFLVNIIYTPQLPAPSLLRRSMVRSPYQATPIPQQHITAVIMDMTWMAHTRENVSMMELGMERLQNAVQQREVSSKNTMHLSIVYKLILTKHLCRRLF